MAFIDGSVISVALPAIQSDLNTSARGAQWIVNAYMLTLGALILIGGAAGDQYGRRRMFSGGVIVFTLASIACGLAPNVLTLVAARAVQGIGGALMVPESLAIISAAFPEKERGKAIGTWAGFSALTTALGPVLGGWLVDASSWRTIFFVNVPLGIATLAITMWRVPESRDESASAGEPQTTDSRSGDSRSGDSRSADSRSADLRSGSLRNGNSSATHPSSIDWPGGLLVTLGLGALAYGLSTASELGWRNPIVLSWLASSLPLLAAFIWWEAKTPAPMMPLELFKSTEFSGANVLTLLLYFALSGAMFFIPFNLISLQGYSAMQAGAAFLPFTLIMGGLSRWSGALIERYGARRPLIIGPIIVAAGMVLCAVPGIGQPYWTTFFPAMLVLGFGMAVSVAPLTTTVMQSAGDRHSGVASGVNNAVSRIAGLLAVALLGAIAVDQFRSTLDARLTAAHVSPETAHTLHNEAGKLAAATVPKNVPKNERDTLTKLLHESFLHSFRIVMILSALLSLASSLSAALTIRPRATPVLSQKRPVVTHGQLAKAQAERSTARRQ